ncbi:tRNA 2-selenouridine(34) synthase MnmH [Lacibacter luteus]|uniref:tRNA 2-selenouridine(34) synthase MnmH n=1 Tax=Lacibacter luteus TaxID=2508719 RepID=A0A4Q1CK04_9BACT|nr:tRNA 2-selenouridine(34) synthase MnmH [Lacibacter luteus]RXK60704.1 tRNA 2-selenouridine(34) synthase MnmH [Lacibacter luteus]
MAVKKITIEEFLTLSVQYPVLDVRSPGEYKHAHLKNAFSFPLFTDEERKVVGTAYKQESRQKAIKLGLDYFGVKMRKMVEEAEYICDNHKPSTTRTVLVHCWRGGMRSGAIAWLLDLYGFDVYTLVGGYKSFRKWVLAQFEKEYSFKVLGGYTGSGKTLLLEGLQKRKQNVVDLEALAHHKGSAFGNLGMPAQPTQEQFENLLALSLWNSSLRNEAIWVEDESQRIGDVNIPINLWRQMRQFPLLFVDIPFEERLSYLVEEYGKHERERLVNAIIRIKKRLGGLETKEAINALVEERIADCFRILLTYYDKWYLKGMHNREQLEALLIKIPCKTVSVSNIDQLIQQPA